MDRQNICFITTRLKGDHCFDKLVEMGFQTMIPYKDYNLLLRCMREAWFRLHLPCRQLWYNGRCKRARAEIYIVRDSLITPDFMRWLRRCHPKARIVLDYENLVRTTLDPETIDAPGIELWSYDDGDCACYGMKQKGIAYYDTWKMEKSEPPVYDVVYVGRDKGRAEKLFQMEKDLQALGLHTCFHICADRKFLRYTKPFYKKLLTYAEYLELAGKGKAIMNIAQEGCCNLTLRELEAVFHGIKCVTNNAAVKQFDLYDPSRYFVLGEDAADQLPAFLQIPFKEVLPEELEQYRFADYVERMCDKKS